MKIKTLVLALTLVVSIGSFSAEFPDYKGLVNDFEEVLSEKEEKGLTKILQKNELKNNVKIILVSTKSYAPAKDFRTYVFGLFKHWKITSESGKDGMLILISKHQKDLKIIPGKNLKVILGEREIKDVVENIMTPKFLIGKHYVGLKKGIKSMVKSIKSFNQMD